MSFDTRAQRENRARIIAEANTLIPAHGAAMTEEVRNKFDKAMADADALKADIDRIERAAAIDAELRTAQPVVQPAYGTSEVEAAARADRQAKAFDAYLRKGERGLSAEQAAEVRTLSDTTGNLGAYTIPQGFQRELETALKFYGGVRQVARRLVTTTGAALPWPTMNDTQNQGRRLSGGSANEVDMSFGVVNFGAWTYTTEKISIPNELLQDTAFDLQAELGTAFVDRIGRVQNTEFTLYANNDGPQGLVPFTVAGGKGITGLTGETVTVSYDNLVDLTRSVDIAYRQNSWFMFNDQTFGAIRKLKDNYGRPLLEPGLNGGDPDKILGYKYVINNDIPVMAAGAVSILFGQFQKYVIRDVADLQIKRLVELGALSNQTVFVGFARTDARGIDAGTHPIVSYTNSAS